MGKDDWALVISLHKQGIRLTALREGVYQPKVRADGALLFRDREVPKRYEVTMGGAGGLDWSVEWPEKGLAGQRLRLWAARMPDGQLRFAASHLDARRRMVGGSLQAARRPGRQTAPRAGGPHGSRARAPRKCGPRPGPEDGRREHARRRDSLDARPAAGRQGKARTAGLCRVGPASRLDACRSARRGPPVALR